MSEIYVRPANGLVLRMPDGGTLPAEGMQVEPSLFWQRRLADGDVVAGEPPAPPAKPIKKEG